MQNNGILQLNLKKLWFDKILSGEKKEEYRDVTDYWARRFLLSYFDDELIADLNDPSKRYENPTELTKLFDVGFRHYKLIHFRNGYKKDSPAFDIEIKTIKISQGKEEWGAEKGKYYFTSVLGEIL